MEGDSGVQKHPQQLIFENVSPATRLLEKRRQMYEVQDALEQQKTRFVKEEEQFKKKEDQLRAKDLQLQHQLIRFNKFLQDNEAKRRRAETRAAEESAQIKQKEEEISELEQQLEDSKQQCVELEEEVARNMKFEEFLERCKDTCDDYSEIQDLVTRYETLESANKDLMDNQTYFESKNEELRSEFQQYKKERAMEILAFTNRIAILQGELEDAQKTRQGLEQTADLATQEDSEHSLHFGQILMSVENLFLRCTTKRKNIQHATTPQDEENTAKDQAQEGVEENEDSFKKKQQKAIFHLRVLLAYLKDFKDIVQTLKRERMGVENKKQVIQTLEQPREPMPEFMTSLPDQAKSSNPANSQSNTKDKVSGKEAGSGPLVADSKTDTQ
jgi:hypothetical protein